ncbi:MAG: tetratricopeptide repeat protein [Blastocatellia bacterium]
MSQTQSGEGRRLVALSTGIGEMAFGRAEYLDADEEAAKREALRLFNAAYEAQMRGELDAAADLYRQSIAAYPTAEAHTFLGWAYSFMKRTDDAIAECLRAIEVDPDFGNPYNDIGAYLIEKGDLLSAVPWLRRAMNAPRYEAAFYPHFNLGRVYEAERRYLDALDQYEAAVQLNPQYALAARALRRLQSKVN